MGLKLLLSDLEEGLQTYPNHNTPSSAGGFNYGGGSIFNKRKFNQRSLEFGKGKAYDRPGMEFSREPFIGKNIELPGLDDTSSGFLDFITGFSDGLVRGGITTAVSRSAKDIARITKFYLSQRGIGFLAAQIGLQASNPKIEAGSSSFSVLGLDFNLDRNRTFNLGLNLIAQAGVNFTGIHFDRSGATPIWPEDQKYEKIVRANANSELSSPNPRKLPEGGNRMISLYLGQIQGSQGTDPGESGGDSKFSQFMSKVGDKIKEFTGRDGEILYEYNGGPNSLYGLGKTTLFKYTNTHEASKLGGITKEELTKLNDLRYFNEHNSITNVKNYLRSLGRPGFNYQGDAKGGRKFNRESRLATGNPGTNPDNNSFIKHINSDNSINYNVYDVSKVDQINMLDVFETEGNVDVQQVRDLIKFRFEAINTDNPAKSNIMIFRAFLDSFTDNYNANHNEFNYNGRGETFYTYNSFKRNINLTFKIAAQTRHEMMPLYRKLNYLVSNTAPEYSGNRMRTPYMKLTVGSMVDRVPGVLNSVSLSWQKDYPWEIAIDGPEGGNDKHMLVLPHVLDVSVQFTPIHNFLPEKSINSPFILPHENNRGYLAPELKWYLPGVAKDISQAKQLGIKRISDIINPEGGGEALIQPKDHNNPSNTNQQEES